MNTHQLPVLSRLRTPSRLAALAIAIGVALGVAAIEGRQPAAPAQPAPVPPKPLFSNADPVRSCESLKSVALPDTTIESAAVDPGDARTPPSCRVTATVTHPPAGDQIKVFIGLPLKGWNGRFQGTGGGGFSGGSAGTVRQPLALGYAAGATDTGHDGGSGSFALDSNGRLNWQSIRDNAYLGIHEMTVVGKALTQELYGNAPRYSYFNGCSTGGRQGLSEAQRYPADYHGILAGAPAINWTKLHPEQLWGAVVMNDAKHVVATCKLEAAVAAAVAACDAIDGVKDGVIGDPHRCSYDPKALVGTAADNCEPITEADADVIRKIWEGPKRRDGSFLWYGLPRGAPFTLSATGGTPLAPRPFPITLDWFRYFLTQDPRWDFMTLTPAGYEQLWDQSVEQFSDVLATDNPDLSGFRDRGGKLIVWHGYADPLIYADGTIDYVKRVQQQMGGADKTAQFVRLFLAPGVGHCGGGSGPAPSGQFEAVVRWVEEGQAPQTLQAVSRNQQGEVTRTRPLCQYPLVARYKGQGSTDEAANFECKEAP
jgi:feruloyl esterase